MREHYRQTVDFSPAQERGILDAWINHEFEIWRLDNVKNPLQDSKAARSRIELETEGVRRGCDFHVTTNMKKISKSADFIGKNGAKFERMFYKLKSSKNASEFEGQYKKIELEFPVTRDWLKWWCQGSRRSMWVAYAINEVALSGPGVLEYPAPTTSNAAESINILLYRANGGKVNNSIVDGIKSLYDTAQSFGTAQLNATQCG